MLTFFTTAKPFVGHDGMIQRNALKSWTLLHRDVEVILFGDDEGAADVASELGIRHEPHIERHESGLKYLNYIFDRAQQIARHNYLCYANCDIVLMDDFWSSFETARKWRKSFLLTGYRWDTEVTQPIDFGTPGWSGDLRKLAVSTGFRQLETFVDFFTFSKGLYNEMPPLVIGRSYWDHWLVWKAIDSQVPVIDCTSHATVVHQNHNYGYHPAGKLGTHEDPLAMRNLELSGGPEHQRHLAACTHAISRHGKIHGAWERRALATKPGHALWKFAVHDTLWLRRRLGLRRENLRRIADRLRGLVGNAPR